MKIRSLIPLLLLLLASLTGQAQDCHDIEVESVEAFPDDFIYETTIIVLGDDAHTGGFLIEDGTEFDYGVPVTIVSPCGQDLDLTITDRLDPNCTSTLFVQSPDCPPDPCAGFALSELSGSGPCTTDTPVYEIIGGTYPMELFVSTPSGEVLQTIPGPNPIIDFAGESPDSYFITLTDAEGCVTATSFVIGTGNCSSIIGISWLDTDRDGAYDSNEEPGVPTEVLLLDENGAEVSVTSADGNGGYAFNFVPAGTYQVQFILGNNLFPTVRDAGPDGLDSDIDEFGFSHPIEITSDDSQEFQINAGWVDNDCAIDVSFTNPDCGVSNGTISAEAVNGQFPVTYTWSTGDVAATITDLPADRYTVTVTFADGCEVWETVTLTDQWERVTISQQGSICNGDGVTLSVESDGDEDPSTWVYEWDTGETTPTITVFEEGRYSVTVTNFLGCESVASTFADESGNVPLENEYRLECETGTVLLTLPDGYDGQFALWVTPEGDFPGDSIVVSTPGGLFLEYSDPNSACQGFGQSSILDPRFTDEVEITVFNPNNEACPAQVSLFVDGLDQRGAAFDFAWTGADGPIGQNSPILRVPPVGLYQVVVTSECGSRTLQYNLGDTAPVCQDVSGRLFLDLDAGCSLTDGDIPVPGNLVEITSVSTGETYTTLTDNNGVWGTELPEGDYTVTAMYDELAAVGTCPPVSVTLAGGSVTDVDVFLPVTEACPLLSSSINSWRFRRCFRNQANIFYENRGTGEAAGAVLTLTVDPFFEDITADLPFTQDGDVLTFDLGDVPVFGSGTILLNFTVSCEAELGQLHCLEASLTPDAPCVDPEDWTGAVVNVSGARCDGDDEIVFTIRNVGESMMSVPLSYVIIEDGIMMLPAPTVEQPMEAGGIIEIVLPATGGTYQVVANQEPNAPASSRPSDLVEGCNGRTTGFGNLTENGNGNPGESVFCRENIGAYDPNEKLGFPIGFTEEHDIEPRTTLTYELHFQNTGTDTAFTVVIRDTISELYDLSSLKLGASSHAYTATLDSQRVLTFTFDNILLPDSTTNLLGSQGVVTFVIDPLADLERGTRIRNRAGIYFDFNEPIITEWMNHRIAPERILLANRRDGYFAHELTLRPNPVTDRLTVEVADWSGQATLTVFDGLGRPVLRRAWSADQRQLNVSTLAPGAYHLTLRTADGRLSRGKTFVVGR